ncbi:MAG: hypothetical protein HGA45_43230 [Chloroflexales bacterium]|nr:hypothetical protein [Chloroflexales bacterium]
MRHLIRIAVAAALLLLLATPALAQGRVIIDDPGGRLDEDAVRQAARALVNRGATVAVYIVDSGGQEDFVERLVDDGLARSNEVLLSNVIGIYVAVNDRFSSIAFGDQWSDALAVNDNYEVIRKGDLGPGLSDGDFTGGVATALGAINEAIENPPVPGGGTNINFDPTPIVLGLGGLAAAGVGGAVVISRRRTAKSRADAQQRLKDAREGAGAIIADLGRRFKDAEEKAKYDKVSYAADDVTRVQSLQREASARFTKVQGQFDDVGEQLERYEKPTNEQLGQATAGYEQVKAEAQQASEALKVVEELRAKLDEQARLARGEIERAKKS